MSVDEWSVVDWTTHIDQRYTYVDMVNSLCIGPSAPPGEANAFVNFSQVDNTDIPNTSIHWPICVSPGVGCIVTESFFNAAHPLEPVERVTHYHTYVRYPRPSDPNHRLTTNAKGIIRIFWRKVSLDGLMNDMAVFTLRCLVVPDGSWLGGTGAPGPPVEMWLGCDPEWLFLHGQKHEGIHLDLRKGDKCFSPHLPVGDRIWYHKKPEERQDDYYAVGMLNVIH